MNALPHYVRFRAEYRSTTKEETFPYFKLMHSNWK
jgi:hypothetical protein